MIIWDHLDIPSGANEVRPRYDSTWNSLLSEFNQRVQAPANCRPTMLKVLREIYDVAGYKVAQATIEGWADL